MNDLANEIVGESAFRPSRLIMFSGGIDSTYLLKQALVETDDEVIAHHVHIVNREGRHEAEAQACRKIVDYCRTNFRPFRYSESLVNRSGFAAAGFDVITVAAEGGIAASNYLLENGHVPDNWMLGLNEEELNELDGRTLMGNAGDAPSSRGRLDHVLAVMAASCYPNQPPRLLRPEIRPKKALIDFLGDDLARLCWTCRRPKRTSSGFEECGECKTCRLMATIREADAA